MTNVSHLLLTAGMLGLCVGGCRCGESPAPDRPPAVPASAVWAGGVDGGSWVVCAVSSPKRAKCQVYDETGDLVTDDSFTSTMPITAELLRKLGHGFDGRTIGISDGGFLEAEHPLE